MTSEGFSSGDLHIRRLSIDEDLTDEDDEDKRRLSQLDSKDARRKRLRKMSQRAASLKFSSQDFVALSPDKLKKHYTIGKLLHRGAAGGNGAGAGAGANAIKSSRSLNGSNSNRSLYHSNSTHSTSSANANTAAFQYSPHANIHECLHRETGIQRAVKVIKKSTRWNHRHNQRVQKEFRVLKALDHPNLVRAYEFFEGKDHYYIIMDLCPGGDLCQELDAWGRLQEEDAALLLKQVLTVLSYCHVNGIVHGNIKPEHILLEQDKDLERVKLTDFSSADIIIHNNEEMEEDPSDDENQNSNRPTSTTHNNNNDDDAECIFTLDEDEDCAAQDQRDLLRRSSSILPERFGTPDYWAPEVVLKGSSRPKRDVWACGVLCYLVLSNQLPFHGNSREEICERIIRGEFTFRGTGDSKDSDEESEGGDYDEDFASSFYSDYLDGDAPIDETFSWRDISDKAKSFIKMLLTYEEDKRPTARQALKHPWILQMTNTSAGTELHLRQSEIRNSNMLNYPASSTTGAKAKATKRNNENSFVNSMATMAAWHNVTKFNASSKLKQATLTFIAAQMVLTEERKAIDHIFRTLDIYKDGRLSRKEVQIGYRGVFHRDLTEVELDDLFARVDLNNSGFIEYSEFLVAAMNESDLLHREKLQQAFSVFDRDGSGTISKDDLKGVLSHFKGSEERRQNLHSPKQHRFGRDRFQDAIDDEAIDKILQQADQSGDGQITYEDFLAIMLKTTDEDDDEEEETEDHHGDDDDDGGGDDVDEGNIRAITPLSKSAVDRAQTTSTIESACSAEKLKTLKFTTHDFVAKRHGDLTDYYDIEDFIDEGGFGKVYLCVHKATKTERALKVINKSRWRKHVNTKIINEFQLLRGLAHPTIIKFFDLFQDKSHFYVVMSICKGGTLCEELDAWGKLSEVNAAILMKQILSCMVYCHGRRIIHRDLKPDNILLEQGKDFRQIKIIDFGLATIFENGVEMTDRVGTTEYMAPEVVEKSYFGSSCDIWSVGVICYLVLSNEFPFEEKTNDELYMAIVAGKYSFPTTLFSTVSEDAKSFIQQLLSRDPKNRPTAEMALQHPWLADAPGISASVSLTPGTQSAGSTQPAAAVDDSTRHALTNMQTFKKSRLKEAVRTFVSSQLLLAEEKNAIDEVLSDLDITCNGKLSKSEVQAAYFKFFGHPLGDEELEDLFLRVDRSNSGFIQYGEFVVATMNERVILGRNKLRKAFELFDDDGNGLISASDLKRALTLYGQNQDLLDDGGAITRLIKQVDADDDGNISYEEFVGLMMLSTDEDIEVRV